MLPTQRIRDRLAEIHAGRRVLIVAEVLQATRSTIRCYREMGAESIFVIAGRMGSGPVPDVPYALLDLPAMPFMALIHRTQDALQRLPPDLIEAIDAWDPDRRAMTVGPFYFRGDSVAGRPYFGARPAVVQALEDKARIDAVWDAAGISRAPCLVESARLDRLLAAHQELDEGHGTVWAADDRDGFNGGAAGTRWVRHAGQADSVWSTLSAMANRIRVMPFLEGIPCSIHGVVFAGGTVVLRPAEMVVLRTQSGSQFRYMRAGTYWDPRLEDRDEMRAIARRFGQHLAESVHYRGAFTIDGVMTAAGFRPTECNPRLGAALNLMVGGFPIADLSDALIAGCAFDEVDLAALEAELLAYCDANRNGSFGILTDTPFHETRYHYVSWDEGAWTAVDEASAHATIMVGPGPSGGFVNMSLDPAHTPVGPSLAPRAAAFVDWADANLGTAMGPCLPAPDVRPR